MTRAMSDLTHDTELVRLISGRVLSMTGFARAAGEAVTRGVVYGWAWEVRSVNGKGLDIRLRLPPGYDWLEPMAREQVARRLNRGSVSLTLDLKRRASSAVAATINRPLLDLVLRTQQELAGAVDRSPPRLEALLAIRGMVETAEPEENDTDRAALAAAAGDGLAQALDGLISARGQEGARLLDLALSQLGEIERLAQEARGLAALLPHSIAQRLKRQIDQALGEGNNLSPDRLAQEIALIAAKSDATEELDRLKAHAASARDLLAQGGPIGRRLDFLAQELNREANTLASKSGDLQVTRVALALKSVIEQFREQIQNVE